jgi:hypothetical protein
MGGLASYSGTGGTGSSQQLNPEYFGFNTVGTFPGDEYNFFVYKIHYFCLHNKLCLFLANRNPVGLFSCKNT